MSVTLAQVHGMKRAELQALCKEIGAKANGKTEALQQAVIKHFKLDAAPHPQANSSGMASSAAKSKAKTGARTTKKSVAQPEEEDEMRLGDDFAAQAKVATLPVAAPQIVYATSPGTKKTVSRLLETVENLERELQATRSSMPNYAPAVMAEAVAAVVDEKIETLRQQVDSAFKEHVSAIGKQLDELKKEAVASNELFSKAVTGLADKVSTELGLLADWRIRTNEVIDILRTDVVNLTSTSSKPQTPARAAQAVSAAGSERPLDIRAAAPSPAMSDAPPTQSLLAMSSPRAPQSSTPGMAVSVESATRSIRRSTHLAGTPAALPAHMLSHVSPTKTSRHVQAASPARPAVRTIGKHARDSDASEASTALDTAGHTPARSIGPSPARSSSSHSRKRLRVSSVSVFEDDCQGDEVEQVGGLTHATFETRGGETTFEDPSEMLDRGEDAFAADVGDFVVKTKTGDEGGRASSRPVPGRASISDPSFFAQPGAGLPPRSPSAAAPRKSLPVSSLPFPIVSPFVARTAKSVQGTPRSAAKKLTFGNDASNVKSTLAGTPLVRPTPQASKTLYGTERLYEDDAGETSYDSSSAPRFDDFAETTASARKPWSGTMGLFGV